MKCTIVSAQTLYSAITFRCLLDSLARPGKVNQLEYPHVFGEPPQLHVQAEHGYER